MRLIGVLAALLTGSAALAQEQPSVAVLEAHLLALDGSRFSFNQQVTGANGETASAAGTLAYLRPAQFRLDYQQPEQILIVSDGKQVWIYDAVLNQVVVSEAKSSQAARGFLAILAQEDLERDFALAIEADAQAQLDWLQLTPFDKEYFQFETCALGFDRAGQLMQMQLSDVYGNNIRVEFFAVSQGVTPELFSFDIPDGAEVIREGS